MRRSQDIVPEPQALGAEYQEVTTPKPVGALGFSSNAPSAKGMSDDDLLLFLPNDTPVAKPKPREYRDSGSAVEPTPSPVVVASVEPVAVESAPGVVVAVAAVPDPVVVAASPAGRKPDASSVPAATLGGEAAAPKVRVSRRKPGVDEADDPNSDAYRFKDTGYVPGSRKELAALSAELLREAGRTGCRVRAGEVNWEALEANPREARDLVTKSHLFGTVDWEALKAGGMTPGAGFLVDRIYAAIPKEPTRDDAMARRDYAEALDSLRDRLEVCKTSEDVTKVIDEMLHDLLGTTMNETEKGAHQAVTERLAALYKDKRDYSKEFETLFNTERNLRYQIQGLESDQNKRTRRGWKPDPAIDEKIAALVPERDAARKAWEDFQGAHPFYQMDIQAGKKSSDYDLATRELYGLLKAIETEAKKRNLMENPFHRGLLVMGERMANVLNFRSARGAFANHVASVRADKVQDWSWMEKEGTNVPRATTQESVRFQLKIADKFERKGGREVQIAGTDDLKALFKLREIQSGNYVLRDYNAAKFHVENCARAFADLADLMGIEDPRIGIGGELAMAFGARGTGNAGWRGAAAAEWSPTYRIINLTKEHGGGGLAHEWWHATSNLMPEIVADREVGKHDCVMEDFDLLPESALKAAYQELERAIWAGDKQVPVRFEYTAKEYVWAKRELEGRLSRNGLRAEILQAGNLGQALAAISRAYPPVSKEAMKNMPSWQQTNARRDAATAKNFMTIAAAWYGGNPEGGKISAPAGKKMSSYAYEAHKLDAGRKPYWATTEELAARAFHAWTEDRLAGMGRQNDYLACMGDNKYYVDPLFGPMKPYPEGEERERINKAFDRLVEELRKTKFATGV